MQPLVIFDIDGTLTDFRGFIKRCAIPYFEKKYGMKAIDPNALEIQDIFRISEHYSPQEEKRMLDRFWISHRFIKFSLLDKYKKDAVAYIRILNKHGYKIELHTSRDKTCEKSLVGWMARCCTILQCWISGVFIPAQSVYFYENDEKKVKGIVRKKPLLVYDDKAELISSYSENRLKPIYISFSDAVDESIKLSDPHVACIGRFDEADILNACKKLYGAANWEIVEKEARSDRFFRKLLPFGGIIRSIFKPKVINEPRDNGGKAIIYAPNHIKTVDPLILEAILETHIHWVALKRFFDGKDSIFNNSKNPILCRITQELFCRLDYFPIERKWDNEKANNLKVIRDMYRFLLNGFSIGIFPEGTTRKENNLFFGNFDKGFADLAVKSAAIIQPILIYWRKHPVIYFGELIDPKGMNSEEIMEKYINIQKDALEKCRELIKKNKRIKSI